MPPAKKTTPKAPSDHLAPKEKPRPEDTPGWDLLKDFSDIPVWDQTPLIALIQSVSDDAKPISDEEYNKMSPKERDAYNADRENHSSFDVNILGEIALALRPFAKDDADYVKFVSGKGALERAMNLGMAWVGQMGEFGNSDDS